MHGLIFETSVCYWQNQPGCYLYRTNSALLQEQFGTGCGVIELQAVGQIHKELGFPPLAFQIRTSSIDYASTDFISNEIRAEEPEDSKTSLLLSLAQTLIPDAHVPAFRSGFVSSTP
jgi:hypothetical protein